MATESPTKQSFSQHLTNASNQNGTGRVTLTWDNLNLTILAKDVSKSKILRPKYKYKRILRNLSGKCVSGELLAIMGPTGCGKTSLMNVLAARVASLERGSSKLTGSICINGKARDDESFRRISAYVLQDDRLYPHLTVNETLMMSAHFFLPDFVTLEQKKILVASVISELGLGKTVDTIIGDEKVRGISGGERKRANIAVQLISDPAVLFLDEPTSGLDSFQAQAVMESMKNMALNGRLVITVIHQPRSSIFDMFDKLLLLSEGRSIYLGDATAAVSYFASNGFNMNRFFNPADFFLDVLSPDTRSKELEHSSHTRIFLLSDRWTEKVNNEGQQSVKQSVTDINASNIPVRNPLTLQRYIRNLKLLFWRSWTEITRDRFTIVVKIALTTFFGCIIGGMYSANGNDQASIRDREGLLFIICLNQGFNSVIGVLNTFPKEKLIVNRERSSNAYDTLSYFGAKFFAEMPVNVLPSFIFGCIIYWIVGLNRNRFGLFILILMLEIVTGISLGLAVSAISPNVEVAAAIGIPLTIVALIFGGFYINLNSLPIVANWVPYISFLRWTFQALCINEFKGENFTCDDAVGSQCLETGDDVLNALSFNDQTLSEAVLGLGCMLMLFFFGAILILEFSRMRFISLGHVGGKMKNLDENEEDRKALEEQMKNDESAKIEQGVKSLKA